MLYEIPHAEEAFVLKVEYISDAPVVQQAPVHGSGNTQDQQAQ